MALRSSVLPMRWLDFHFSILGSVHSKEVKSAKVRLENDIFGEYKLSSGNTYFFNLETVGRDPKLKRNNLFMAKRRVYKLVERGIINNPSEKINKIAMEL